MVLVLSVKKVGVTFLPTLSLIGITIFPQFICKDVDILEILLQSVHVVVFNCTNQCTLLSHFIVLKAVVCVLGLCWVCALPFF